MNIRSIGIEMVSAGEDYTEAQVLGLTELVGDLHARYGVSASM